MKVIHISNYFAAFRGSFIHQLELLGERIVDSGGEMIFIFPYRAKEIEWCKSLCEKYRVYFVSCINRKNKNKVLRELKEIVNTEKPDIVHSHFDGYDVSITKATSKSVVKFYHRHNEFDISKLCWYKKIYALATIRKNMTYLKKRGYSIFTSKDMLNEFLNKKYVLPEKSNVIINGIATKRLDEIVDIEKIYDKPVIFSIIGNWDRKGGDIIFNAIEKINSNEIKVYLASIVSKEFIKEKCGYIPKWLIDLDITDNINQYYSMANIFVSASRKETFSYALAEAVYCGLPCISSYIGGVQWAKELPNVKFFLNEDVEELIIKILDTIDNPINENEISISKEIIKEKYSEYTWCKNIYSYYIKLVDNKGINS